MAPRPTILLPQVPDDWLSDDSQTPSQQNASNGQTGQGNGSSQSSPEAPSTTLEYDGAARRLTLVKSDGTTQAFPANNNVDSSAHMTHWPNGIFSFDRHHTHPEDAPDSAYGSYGGYRFNVPGHQNLEVHSGRVNHIDGLGRSGVNFPTLGCIRTTDDGVAAIRDAISSGYPLQSLTVRNND
jgi:hypothetical protein